MSLVHKSGSQCIELVKKASECYRNDPNAAKGYLKKIKMYTPDLLEGLKIVEKERERKRDELQGEERQLEYQINSKESEKERLRKDIGDIEARRARNEAQLEDRKNDLRAAESKKRDALREKDNAVAGTVAGGVGAGILGIIFPPSLIVTVPAVAAAGTISITDANEAVDRCRDRVRDVERDIENDRQKIQSANDTISGIQSDIGRLQSKLQPLYSERGNVRKTIVFLQKAVTYFAELYGAVEGGQQRTGLLHRLVELATKRERYTILNSRGVTIVANSFGEAWGKVEESVLSGDRAGMFSMIECEELPRIN